MVTRHPSWHPWLYFIVQTSWPVPEGPHIEYHIGPLFSAEDTDDQLEEELMHDESVNIEMGLPPRRKFQHYTIHQVHRDHVPERFRESWEAFLGIAPMPASVGPRLESVNEVGEGEEENMS